MEEKAIRGNLGSLILRPLNVEVARKEAEEIPRLVMGDIALVLSMEPAYQRTGYFTIEVRRKLLEKWGVREREALGYALFHTQRLYPARLCQVENLWNWNMEHRSGRGIEQIRKGSRGYMLTNARQTDGAISVFYPNVAKRIAEAMEKDFLIAFTSVHEAQLHEAEAINPDAIETSLRRTNIQCNRKEETLTDFVYRYCRESGKFQRMKNGVFQDEEFLWEGPDGKEPVCLDEITKRVMK